MTDQKTTSSPSWDKHQKAQWGKLVRTGDWAGAVAFAQDPGFTAADFTRRVPMGPQAAVAASPAPAINGAKALRLMLLSIIPTPGLVLPRVWGERFRLSSRRQERAKTFASALR